MRGIYDLVQFLLAPQKSEGACAAAFAFLFCSQQQLKSDNCCTFFLLLFFSLLVFWLFVLASGSFGRIRYGFVFFFLLLGAHKGIGNCWCCFFLSAFFFYCALGSVHDRSCVGVTSPLRFSPLLCVSFFLREVFLLLPLCYTSFTAPDRYEQADQAD